MSGDLRVPSAAVLKNRGVPVRVHQLDDSGERKFGEDDEPLFAERWVRFDNNLLADIEDETLGWGDANGWEEALGTHPFATIRRTLALMWGFTVTGDARQDREPLRRVGNLMLDDPDLYATALGIAFLIANGTDPTQAGELLRRGMEVRAQLQDARTKVMSEHVAQLTTPPSGEAESGTPGPTGTEPGQSQDTTSSSSGG